MWRSLSVARGDIVMFADADTSNFREQFIYGTLGPLLTVPEVQFTKAAYRRPFTDSSRSVADGGGRVTELMAKPLFNFFCPELTGFVQPLAGEFAGYRDLLCSIPFLTGYGVELGIMVDVLEDAGLGAMAQIDLGARQNRHQSLWDLSPDELGRAARDGQPGVPARARRLCPGDSRGGGPCGARRCTCTAVATDAGLRLDEHISELHERPPLAQIMLGRGGPGHRRLTGPGIPPGSVAGGVGGQPDDGEGRALRVGDHREAPRRGRPRVARRPGRPGRPRGPRPASQSVTAKYTTQRGAACSGQSSSMWTMPPTRAAAEPPLGVGGRPHLAGLGLPAETPGRRNRAAASVSRQASSLQQKEPGSLTSPQPGKAPGCQAANSALLVVGETWPSGPGRPRPAGGTITRPPASVTRAAGGADVGHADVGVPDGGPLRARGWASARPRPGRGSSPARSPAGAKNVYEAPPPSGAA